MTRRRGVVGRVEEVQTESPPMTAPGTIPTATKATSSVRRPALGREALRSKQRRHDDPRQRDRPPAHGQVAEQVGEGQWDITTAIDTRR